MQLFCEMLAVYEGIFCESNKLSHAENGVNSKGTVDLRRERRVSLDTHEIPVGSRGRCVR